MSFKFTEESFKEIEEVLGIEFSHRGDQYRAVLIDSEQKRKLTLEIFPDIPIGPGEGNLISVYTASAHIQLHFCSGFVASEMLGEVTFIGEHNGYVSGIIIEKNAACSTYCNVDSALLSGDFTKLGPEVMLSGVALSLAEHLLETTDSSK